MREYVMNPNGNSMVALGKRDDKLSGITWLSNVYLGIDYAWIVKEDGTVYFENKTYDVKANDIVIRLYGKETDNRIVVVSSKEWVAQILEREDRETKMSFPCDKPQMCDEAIG